MKSLTYLFCAALLVFVCLAGCAPDEGDLTPPNAAFDSSLSTISSPTVSTSGTIVGTSDPGSTVVVDTAPAADISNLTVMANGDWSFDIANMKEGTNLILVSVADPAGNTRTIQLTVVVDLTGPTTTIDQYPELAAPGPFSFAGTVNEMDASVAVEVLDATDVVVASGVATVDSNIWSVDLDLSLLADGPYTIVATGTDRLGNVAVDTAVASQVITLAAASPAFSITAPALPVIMPDPLSSSTVVFTGTTDPGTLLAVLPVTTLTQPDGVTGDWDATLSGLPKGNKVVTFDVNSGAMVQKVLVVRDQTPPSLVEWDSPLGLNQITILFSETMNPATIDVTNLVVTDADLVELPVIAVTADAANKLFTFDVDPLTVGTTYNVTLQTTTDFTVEDARGNSLAASQVWVFKKQ